MIIQADEEGKKAVVQLCDIALKVGGLQNLRSANQILACLTDAPDKNVAPPGASEKKVTRKKRGRKC